MFKSKFKTAIKREVNYFNLCIFFAGNQLIQMETLVVLYIFLDNIIIIIIIKRKEKEK